MHLLDPRHYRVKHPLASSMHHIVQNAYARLLDSVQIDLRRKIIKVPLLHADVADFPLVHKLGKRVLAVRDTLQFQNPGKLLLYLCNHLRMSRPAEVALDLEAVVRGWIVARGNHNAARSVFHLRQQRHHRCRHNAVGKLDPETGVRHHLGRFFRKLPRHKASVVSNDDAVLDFLVRLEISCCGKSDLLQVRKGEVITNDCPPAVCAEFYWLRHLSFFS